MNFIIRKPHRSLSPWIEYFRNPPCTSTHLLQRSIKFNRYPIFT